MKEIYYVADEHGTGCTTGGRTDILSFPLK